ncbi:cupin domain-containing protein [Halocynthiibacter sp. C4]|uniref:cupin domain-containing protein n=1 Tax=Halocynthiibacter sp. C4 TaxID=2992758 RepID=UPI00237BB7CE|nr:cupin domain-containing protein [Halocynthiibacter sp. C4]MDE0589590.1 cupin domain-containing protein [Halocynthiibacter sp. C4]
MLFPEFVQSFPDLDVPFSTDVVTCKAIRSDAGLVVFFTFHEDFSLPMHAHKGQWGTIIKGEATLTIGEDTKTYRPGDTYNIPSGVSHGGEIKAGTEAIDVFEEPDRYPVRG